MLRLEDIKKNAAIAGIDPAAPVRIMVAEPVGQNALTVIYKTADGSILERMLFRNDEGTLSIAVSARPWAFDASAEDFKLATEALRIHLAHLFDPMMAVHTSNVEPLPHQITAVYESMLPKQPLRFVLADDPGAGKTIMAGLYIRELIMRADAARILIVAPGSLVNQWQDELFEKFGLNFTLFSREHVEQSVSGNPFDLGLRPDEALSPFALAHHLQVLVISPEALSGLSTSAAHHLCVTDADSWSAVTLIEGDRKLVILNPSHSAARKNSDLAHELSHLILEHKPTQVFFGPDKSLLIREFDRVQEAEAECLSSVLLVPREALLALLPISDDEMAAQQLGVSTQMFRMRRNVTGVDRQLARRW